MKSNWLAAVALGLAGAGCSLLSAPPDVTRFALLASVDELSGGTASPEPVSTLRVGLGPVDCPEYLRGRELVSRVDGTRIVLSSNERWAEAFESSLSRVLAADLQRALGTGKLLHHPWYETDQPEVQVEIAFSRCERDASGSVIVACHWTVRRLDASPTELARDSHLERRVSGEDGAVIARAISECLAELSQTIAAAVREATSR